MDIAQARDLPWRQRLTELLISAIPYRVWLSEIMLQQTRVAAVMAHYHARFCCGGFRRVELGAGAQASDGWQRRGAVWDITGGRGCCMRRRRLWLRVLGTTEGSRRPQKELLGAAGRRAIYGGGHRQHCVWSRAAAVVDGNVERVLQRLSRAATEQGERIPVAGRRRDCLDQLTSQV